MAIRLVMTGDVKLRARVLFPTLTFHINNSLYCIDIALPQQRKSPYIHLYLFYPHTHTQAPLKVRGSIIQQGYSRRIRHLVISRIVDTSVMMSGTLALYKGGRTKGTLSLQTTMAPIQQKAVVVTKTGPTFGLANVPKPGPP